jgi:hypothetical protein
LVQNVLRLLSAKKMKRIWIIFSTLVACGCAVIQTPAPGSTATLTATTVPTATIEWFPPSSTPEPPPTVVIIPTQELKLEIGEVLFTDDFNSPENWIVPQTSQGEINVANGEINIIINEPKSLLTGTLEKPDLSDFYAEITANPVLCTGQDEYGFLFRVIGRDQYYRLGVTCDGEIRLDKKEGGVLSVLQPAFRSGSIPIGAPSVSTLEVLALRDEIRIFIDGDPQFTVFDEGLIVGSFGVYARSTGDTAVTVSFSELIVRDVIPK